MSDLKKSPQILFVEDEIKGERTLRTELINFLDVDNVSNEMLEMIILSTIRLLQRKGYKLEKVIDVIQKNLLVSYPQELKNMMEKIAEMPIQTKEKN